MKNYVKAYDFNSQASGGRLHAVSSATHSLIRQAWKEKRNNENSTVHSHVQSAAGPGKLAIIDRVCRDREYMRLCRRITAGSQLCEDLFQEVMIALMRYEDEKIIGLHERGELRWFITRIMMTMWRCKTNPFFQEYRQITESFDESRTYGMPYEEYDVARDIFTQHVHDTTERVLEEKLSSGDRTDWYEATMWKLYMSAGSFRKAQAISKIPYKSIANTVRRMKLILSERIELEAGDLRRMGYPEGDNR